jgi:RNA polymerase sigma factor (sigma-70 family)
MSEAGFKELAADGLAYKPGHTKTWNEAWRELYEQLGDTIIAYGRRRGLDEKLAEDVLQEVMATIIRSQHGRAKGYDQSGGAFQAWLWGVIRHRVLEAFRRAGKTPLYTLSQNDDSEDLDEDGRHGCELPPDYSEKEEQEWQRAILDAAMERVRARVDAATFAVFVASLKEEASPDELAMHAGMTRNNVDAIKHRCKKMLIEEAQKIRAEWELLRKPKIKL